MDKHSQIKSWTIGSVSVRNSSWFHNASLFCLPHRNCINFLPISVECNKAKTRIRPLGEASGARTTQPKPTCRQCISWLTHSLCKWPEPFGIVCYFHFLWVGSSCSQMAGKECLKPNCSKACFHQNYPCILKDQGNHSVDTPNVHVCSVTFHWQYRVEAALFCGHVANQSYFVNEHRTAIHCKPLWSIRSEACKLWLVRFDYKCCFQSM